MKANKVRKLYSKNDLENAVKAVKDGMPALRASQQYGVPRTTILDKVNLRTPMDKTSGPDTILSKDEEDLLVQWMFYSAKQGFPVTKDQLLDSVAILVKNLQRENNFSNGRPGRSWFQGFSNRHPQIAQRISQNLSKTRSQVSELKIRNWFQEIRNYLETNEKFEILLEPHRVFNCDESAFYLAPKNDKVLVKKGEKAVYSFINNDEKECLTTLITLSAAGKFPPPMVVFSYKRIPKQIVEKAPEGWGIGHTENGWMTGESFFEYCANVFYVWLVEAKVPFPVILFVDGHKSHLTMALSEFCSEKSIILISLFPNATHILQPLDVAVFRPLKMEYRKSIHKFRMNNNGKKVGREDFAPILKTTLDKMSNIPNIVSNGFKACGLVPFEPNNINFDKYFKESPIRQKQIVSQCAKNETEKTKDLLELMESRLPKTKLILFKNSGANWEGRIKDKSLFMFWYTLKNDKNDNSDNFTENSNDEDQISVENENNIEEQIDIEDQNDTIKQGIDRIDNFTPLFDFDGNLSFPLNFNEADSILNNIQNQIFADTSIITVVSEVLPNNNKVNDSIVEPKQIETDNFKHPDLVLTPTIESSSKNLAESCKNNSQEMTENFLLEEDQTANYHELELETPPNQNINSNKKNNQNNSNETLNLVPTPFKKSLF